MAILFILFTFYIIKIHTRPGLLYLPPPEKGLTQIRTLGQIVASH